MNNGIYRLFATASLVFLGVLAISPMKNLFSDWRKYQKGYNRLLAEQPLKTHPVPISIKQIWVPSLGKVDRCVSCHLGLSETRLTGTYEPFTPHPSIYHDYEKLGCTVCHQGQGLATSANEAMNRTEFWDKPILPREYIESSCGSCHKEENVLGADRLNKGRRMIKEMNCTGCHVISGFTKSFTPPLNGIGSKVSRQWLVRWLGDPYDVKWNSKMPDFMLSDEDIRALADFLMTFKVPPVKLRKLPAGLKTEEFDDETVKRGKARFREARCVSCHTIENRGGSLASELSQIGSKVSRQWLYNFLGNPKALLPGIPMPAYGYNEEELQAVTAYMTTELLDWEHADTDSVEEAPRVDRFERGLQLFNEYNCAGCHDLDYPGITRNMGPELTFVGSKSLYELPLWPDSTDIGLHDYLYGKLENPRQYVGNLRMPKFDLNQDEMLDITVALLALSKREYPPEYMLEPQTPPSSLLKGEFGHIVRKYSCLSCHVIDGEGYLLATDLTFEGSRVQEKWLRDYFNLPYTIRPVLTERMPKLFLSDKEIELLVNFFETVLVNDTLDAINFDPSNTNLAGAGNELLHEKFACTACHQIGGVGGYVGPPLDHTGSRLTPGWIYSWITNPQKYRTDTIEPNAGLTDEEAIAITAYLMSLK